MERDRGSRSSRGRTAWAANRMYSLRVMENDSARSSISAASSGVSLRWRSTVRLALSALIGDSSRTVDEEGGRGRGASPARRSRALRAPSSAPHLFRIARAVTGAPAFLLPPWSESSWEPGGLWIRKAALVSTSHDTCCVRADAQPRRSRSAEQVGCRDVGEVHGGP